LGRQPIAPNNDAKPTPTIHRTREHANYAHGAVNKPGASPVSRFVIVVAGQAVAVVGVFAAQKERRQVHTVQQTTSRTNKMPPSRFTEDDANYAPITAAHPSTTKHRTLKGP
jgi:hypothetical protein